MSDPLLSLIQEYYAARVLFNAVPEDDPGERPFRDAYERLCNDPPIPTTMAGAVAAIKLVHDEESECGSQPDLTIKVLSNVHYFFTQSSRVAILTEAHAETFRLLDVACDVSDNAKGKRAKAEAEAAKAAASDATADAIDAIIQHPYSSLAELGEGIRYLVGHYQTTGDGDPQTWLERLAYAVAGLDENGGAS